MERIVITDIGSTTTKAILVEIDGKKVALRSLFNAPTTVERPLEDVKYGVLEAIKGLEADSGLTLLKDKEQIILEDGIKYLTTSSAGGGLQILVVGLTKVESASVAEKTALGAGGVILDTIAIDDKRSVLEQMEVIRAVHPDIILFSGGYDGGAITGIIRLSEILTLAHPKPKFGKEKIPLVYAGNQSIKKTITGIFSEKFDLHIVDNIRPDLTTENVKPAQDKVHQLFMENVMEQAPGYADIKKVVDDVIIPTPKAVMHAMEILSGERKLNLMVVDIGGATTDIFTYISEKSHRTVSANSGMSYSISNVLADAGVQKIKRWLPEEISEGYICNYISNKMLYPQFVPKDELCIMIEQACAIEAVNIAFNQHMTMHFEEAQRFHFSNIKSVARDPFYEHMYTEKTVDGMTFNLAKIDVVIGAGGVISHAPSKKQALHTIVHGFKPLGITEIWRDVHFISPHLGKLSNILEEEADILLNEQCMERLGLYLRPKFKQKKKSYKLMTITLKGVRKEIFSDNYYYFENNTPSDVIIEMEKNVFLQNEETSITLNTELPILINTVSNEFVPFSVYNASMNLYNTVFDSPDQSKIFTRRFANEPRRQEVIIE
ncbi:MAG: glutamate mutase L, partial [Candidatus Cloacimonetes bacterium]|nr:glutamate mutase L [Candidatus Cloacimonadota bacterium]